MMSTRSWRLGIALVFLIGCASAAFAQQLLTITTYAGPAEVPGHVDGSGSASRFNQPKGVAVDGAGNVFVADSGNHTIRMITPAGDVSTLAGLAGQSGSTDAPGAIARFSSPAAVAVDTNGNVYVADRGNVTIRRISPAGVVTTLAGSPGQYGTTDGSGGAARFQAPTGVAVDSTGTVYVCDTDKVRKISPAGVVTTLATVPPAAMMMMVTLSAIAVAPSGNIYVADSYGVGTISKVTPAGAVSAFTPSFNHPDGVAVDAAENVYVISNSIQQMTPAGVVTTVSSYGGSGIAIDGSNILYATSNHEVSKITAGTATTMAGVSFTPSNVDGAPATARFNTPRALFVDGAGTVYVADSFNQTIRTISPLNGAVSTLAGTAGTTGSDNGSGTAAKFNGPSGIVMNPVTGDLYVSDMMNSTIRKITPGGVVSTFAGSPGLSGSNDGNGAAARFFWPSGIAIDSQRDLIVADQYNHTIRLITPAGDVSTLAGSPGIRDFQDGQLSGARFDYPIAVAVDSSDNIYVADWLNYRIRKVDLAGHVTTYAGSGTQGTADGTGTAASFYNPTGIACDSSGNVYVMDGRAIRKITPDTVVATIAGGTQGNDDGSGTGARFDSVNQQGGIAVLNDVFYVADANNHTIRKGVAESGDYAMIDAESGAAGVLRQLTTSTIAASSWQWSITRRPARSTAVLSSTVIRNPTFTPDVGDRYEFRLLSSSSIGPRISTVALTAFPTGDGNGDGTVTAADVFFAIAALFTGGQSPMGSMDADGDGNFDVADLFYLINYLFCGGPTPHAVVPPPASVMSTPARPATLRVGRAVGVEGAMLTLPVYLSGVSEIDGLSLQLHFAAPAIRSISIRRAGILGNGTPVVELAPRTTDSASYFVAFAKPLRLTAAALVAEIDIELAEALESPVALSLDREKTAVSAHGRALTGASPALILENGVIEVVPSRHVERVRGR